MKIYIDSEFKCHAANPDGIFREVETDAFDGKCDTFLEGYRFVPSGENWVRSDGETFCGELIAPWQDYRILHAVQRQYECDLLEAGKAYREGVDTVYDQQ